MLKEPRQGPSDLGPGPVDPPPTSTPAIGLPLPFSPIVSTETLTFSDTTLTIPVSSIPIPSLTSSGSPSSGSTSPSLTSPSSVSAPTPSSPADGPSFTPLPLVNTTTCHSQDIQWSISNPTSADLTAMNIDLEVHSVGANINATIAKNWPVLEKPFVWNPVNVPEGEYLIAGRWVDGHGTTEESPVFIVSPGNNTSCLASTGASSSSKPINKSAIVGGTVGGVIILACIGVTAFFLYGLRSSPRKRGRGTRRGWGGLNSMDSKASRSRALGPRDSIDFLQDTAIGHHNITSPAGVSSTTTLDAEKSAPPITPPYLPTLEHKAPWMTPTLELARLPSRRSGADSPRSSIDNAGGDHFIAPPSRRASRTARKPVPSYDPTPEELESMAIARTRSEQSRMREGANDVALEPSSSSPKSSSLSHPELHSKSSGFFDGQPMHYLIPDPPL